MLSSPNILSGGKFHLNKYDRIFIHCDVIKYQIVGETQLPLLAILPIQGIPNEQCYWSFNPAYYLPSSQNPLDQLKLNSAHPMEPRFHLEKMGLLLCNFISDARDPRGKFYKRGKIRIFHLTFQQTK